MVKTNLTYDAVGFKPSRKKKLKEVPQPAHTTPVNMALDYEPYTLPFFRNEDLEDFEDYYGVDWE